ncbi:hypothetical protein ERX46_11005 [Brumimicrobium glaciale]|uniref:Thymidylate kinase-like domain-containing protein n=1 Tax=Brumimicrobium glaciale TaxID=200475 RepID=A0A4Q4KJK9_9FLAO|nr:hypothetical protein [Brumimicrobium glaciale]RYM33461.1 hypothetical protein ERX46_11005 [Brumimicrobium glaciale]
MDKLFEHLKDEEVSYFIWKDTEKVEQFFKGNAELDLLVNFNQKQNFEKIIFTNGFIPLIVVDSIRIEKINHYIKYENGKYFHLHVYYDLITGNHYTKEYTFRLDESIFEDFILDRNVKVVDIEGEIAFLSIRLFIKNTMLLKEIKESEVKRLKLLSANYSIKKVSQFIHKVAPILENSAENLINIALEGKKSAVNRKKVNKQLNNYKEIRGLKLVYHYFKIRFNLFRLRINKSSNKTLTGIGTSFSIIGSDGSGKTTITSKLLKQYSAKTSCRKFYLGGNSKTYSIITRLYYFNYYFVRVLSPLKEKYSIAWLLYYNSVTLLELGKAKDRRKKVIKGNKLKSRGWIVIFERYPVIGLFDFPNNLNELYLHKFYSPFKVIDKRIKKINRIINRLEKPDISFLVITDIENMKKRRKLAPNEVIDITRKIKTQKEFLVKNKSELFLIENDDKIERTISKINNEVNKKLCIFNS